MDNVAIYQGFFFTYLLTQEKKTRWSYLSMKHISKWYRAYILLNYFHLKIKFNWTKNSILQHPVLKWHWLFLQSHWIFHLNHSPPYYRSIYWLCNAYGIQSVLYSKPVAVLNAICLIFSYCRCVSRRNSAVDTRRIFSI